MTDDSANFKGENLPDHDRLDPAIEAEIHALTDALLEQTIAEPQRRRLEEIVAAHPGAAEVYLAIMYEWGSLPNYVAPAPVNGMINLSTAQRPSPSSDVEMNETMILPAVHLDFADEEDAPLTLPVPPVVTPVANRRRAWFGITAAMLCLGVTVFAVVRPTHRAPPLALKVTENQTPNLPPATITAVTTLKPLKPGEASAGTTLVAGQPIIVDDGAIEVTLASGATVVVQAPAQFHIVDANSIALDDGRLSAHVPPAARGFRVISAGLLTVDHGTDFGIRTLASSAASEVHVFGGNVDVTGTDEQGRSNSPPVHAVTGEAFAHKAMELAAPVPVAFSPQSFNRDIRSIRRAIPTHNTGDNLAGGDPDPNWWIESAPDELHWKPQPAVVVKDPVYSSEPDAPDCKWISTDATGPQLPRGVYRFKTNIDLTGFDPTTVKMQAAVTADDCVTDIRINGVSTGLSTRNAVLAVDYKRTTLDIPNTAWKVGANQIEIILHNEDADGSQTQMALQVRWAATACTLVQR